MAAIIARLSAANWARKQRNRDKRKIPPEKSNRILPPFDQCYDPEKVDGQFSHKGSCQAIVRQLSGSRQAVARQLSGSRRAVIRLFSGSWETLLQNYAVTQIA